MAELLPFDELDSLIRDVCSGQKLVHVDDQEGNSRLVLLKFPSPAYSQLSQAVYEQAYEEAKEEGLLSVDEMEKIVEERGLFTDKDKLELEVLAKKIEGQKVVLSKTTRVPARRERLIKIIDDLENRVIEIRVRRDKNFEFTRERKAAEQKHLFLTWKGTFDPYTVLPYWDDYDAFKDEPDFIFRRKLYLEYIMYTHGVSAKKMRFMARSNFWRVYYVTATKTGDSLFGCPISEYTTDQLMLLYWSHYYQSIYEMLPTDRPSEGIIEDDEALDAYMKDWQAERNRENSASKAKQGKSKTAWDHGETLVMKSNEMYEDIEYSVPPGGMEKHKGKSDIDAAPTNKSKLRKRK